MTTRDVGTRASPARHTVNSAGTHHAKCWRELGAVRAPLHRCWGCWAGQAPCKAVWLLLRGEVNTRLPRLPTCWCLPGEHGHHAHTNACTQAFALTKTRIRPGCLQQANRRQAVYMRTEHCSLTGRTALSGLLMAGGPQTARKGARHQGSVLCGSAVGRNVLEKAGFCRGQWLQGRG